MAIQPGIFLDTLLARDKANTLKQIIPLASLPRQKMSSKKKLPVHTEVGREHFKVILNEPPIDYEGTPFVLR